MNSPITRRDALVILGMGSLAGCALPGLKGKANAPRPLRVLAYNIRHGEGLDGVVDLARQAEVINAAKPDLVALQEIDVKTGRTGGVDQLTVLAELTGMEHRFGKFMDYDGGEYGLGVLSRFPILAHRVIELPAGKQEPRVALLVRTRPPGWSVDASVVSVHLDWLREDRERFAQAQVLESALRDEPGVVIPAGDFNDVPGSRTIEFLRSKFSEARKPEDARLSIPAEDPKREIDYVFWCGPEGSVASAESWVIAEALASDHRPVMAVLTPEMDQ